MGDAIFETSGRLFCLIFLKITINIYQFKQVIPGQNVFIFVKIFRRLILPQTYIEQTHSINLSVKLN